MESDPFVGWLARPGPRHARARRAYYSLMLERIALPRGRVWVAREEGKLLGAALWAPPHTFEMGARDTLRLLPLMLDIIGFSRMTAVSHALESVEVGRPPEPRWLLTVVGVDPSARRRGIGHALLAPALRECDEEGAIAVCETANPDALAFYARLGFSVVADRDLSDEVTSWTLVRSTPRENN